MSETTPETINERIALYAKTLNKTIGEDEEATELLDFVVQETIDRVQLYLNRTDVPSLIERPLGKVVASIFNKYKNTQDSSDVEREISSMSDNGQSISYSNKVKAYLETSSDEELFGGITPVLSRYRRLNFANSRKA